MEYALISNDVVHKSIDRIHNLKLTASTRLEAGEQGGAAAGAVLERQRQQALDVPDHACKFVVVQIEVAQAQTSEQVSRAE